MKPIQSSERQSLKQTVIQEIKNYIINEQLTAGDQLPPERHLSTMFNVSRAIVREALSYLENTGVVRVRQGQGTFLSESNIDQLLNNFFFLWQINSGNIRDILGLRLVFEASAIEEIVSNNQINAVTSLREIVDASLRANTWEAYRESDMAFHTELLKATNNPLFIQLSNMVTSYFFQIQHVELTPKEYRKVTKEHLDIVDALEQGNAIQAKELLADHISQTKA